MSENPKQRTALVAGAGGFIGHHLVKALKARGDWVKGVDLKPPEFEASPADKFELLDLRNPAGAEIAVHRHLVPAEVPVDDVYNLAADMGGMGYIEKAECDIMRNNALINANMIHAAARAGVRRYFFSSSVCIYPDMLPGPPARIEDEAYPARPHNEYGWEKLYAERMAMAYGRHYLMDVRIARFQNIYGPLGTWRGGREKAPAALCRKVAEAEDGGEIEVWGDGLAIRGYTHVSDLIDGILLLMASDLERPVNIGSSQYVTVTDLVAAITAIACKDIRTKFVPGPVGVQARNFHTGRIRSLGWKPRVSLFMGIEDTFPWIRHQVLLAAREEALA